MARWWKEDYDPKNPTHEDRMTASALPPSLPREHSPLVPTPVYFVSVCSFGFVFRSLDQLRACLEFYQTKILPSKRLPIGGGDSWEYQRWWERLPLYLREESKRQKVVKALTEALAEFER